MISNVELKKTTRLKEIEKKANKVMGRDRTPEGHLWHCVEDGNTLIAIPTDLHKAVKHTGMISLQKEKVNNDEQY
ncbi:HNH endonuclease [Candidatus Tisiphia endosymbiont of Piscicola geometra]|uniref:HNH endonuclease n=1 Tax=Candidatus Tisiphia endosymbiont of Piscicola geometra TaxID=3066273 RepID=UPI00312CBEE2